MSFDDVATNLGEKANETTPLSRADKRVRQRRRRSALGRLALILLLRSSTVLQYSAHPTSAEQNRFSRSLFLGGPRIFGPPALAALRFSFLFALCLPVFAPCLPNVPSRRVRPLHSLSKNYM